MYSILATLQVLGYFSVSLCFQVWYKSLWYTKCGVAPRGCEHTILVPAPNSCLAAGAASRPFTIAIAIPPSVCRRHRRLCCTSQQLSIGYSLPGRVRIAVSSSLFQETNVDVNTSTKEYLKICCSMFEENVIFQQLGWINEFLFDCPLLTFFCSISEWITWEMPMLKIG